MRATYGTINNGIGVVLMGMMRPKMKMKCIVSVVMARMLCYAHLMLYIIVEAFKEVLPR